MNRKVIFGDCGQLSCPYCKNTLIDCQQDYERCYTGIEAEYEYEDRGTPYDMILKNEWYIPEDDYNQRIEYCSGCGKKLNWKDFFIGNYKKYNGLNKIIKKR